MIGRLPLSRSPPQPKTTITPARGERAHRIQHVLQRIGLMGIIDIGQCTGLAVSDEFQTAGSADELFQRLQSDRNGNAGRNGKPGRDQRVGDLEIARERNVHLMDLVTGMNFGNLLVAENARRA